MHLQLVSLPLRVTQEGAVLGKVTVLEKQNQQLGAELEAARELHVQLVDAIQEEYECGARAFVARLVWGVAGESVPGGERMTSLNPLAFN